VILLTKGKVQRERFSVDRPGSMKYNVRFK